MALAKPFKPINMGGTIEPALFSDSYFSLKKGFWTFLTFPNSLKLSENHFFSLAINKIERLKKPQCVYVCLYVTKDN